MGATAGPLAPEYQSKEVHLCFVEDQLLEAKKTPNPPDMLINHTAPAGGRAADARIFLLILPMPMPMSHTLTEFQSMAIRTKMMERMMVESYWPILFRLIVI